MFDESGGFIDFVNQSGGHFYILSVHVSMAPSAMRIFFLHQFGSVTFKLYIHIL